MNLKQRVLLGLFLFVGIEVLLVAYVDRPASDWARDVETIHPAITDFFRSITDFATSKWYLWPSGIGILVGWVVLRGKTLSSAQRQKFGMLMHSSFFFFTSIAASGLITDGLKPIIGRARPVEQLREHIYGFQPLTFHAAWNGMPSGHATTAAAVAVTLSLLLPRGRWLWFCVGAVLAASRIMVNAHYTADVVAGLTVGTLTTLAIVRQRDHKGMFPFLKGIFPIDNLPPQD